MTLQEFITQISDDKGPLQTSASDLMERMSPTDFEELISDMKDKLYFNIDARNF